MSVFNIFRRADINEGLEEFRRTPGALLLDVRSPEEYAQGRIPGSENVPLQSLDKLTSLTENNSIPIFVYCHSGARSRQAEAVLRSMGYSDVRNLGGIASYTGKVETQ